MKRVIIYARTSLGDDRQHIENQTIPLKEFVKQHDDWTLNQVIIDRASGAKDDREGIQKILELTHKRRVDIILVYALDRLSRSGTLQVLQFLRQFADNNVDFVSYSEPYLNTLEGPFKDVIISLLGSLAEVEREKIRTRVKEGLNRARREGKKLGRPKVNPSRITQAKKLKNEGWSYSKISQEMDISRSRVCQLVNSK